MCHRSSAGRLCPEACSTLQWNSTAIPARPATATGSGEARGTRGVRTSARNGAKRVAPSSSCTRNRLLTPPVYARKHPRGLDLLGSRDRLAQHGDFRGAEQVRGNQKSVALVQGALGLDEFPRRILLGWVVRPIPARRTIDTRCSVPRACRSRGTRCVAPIARDARNPRGRSGGRPAGGVD